MAAGGLFAVSYFATYLPWSVRTKGNFDLGGAIDRFIYQILPAIGNELGLNGKTNWFMTLVIFLLTLLACVVLVRIIFKFRVESAVENAVVFMFLNLLLTTFMLTIMEVYEISQRYYTVIFYWIGFCGIYFYRHIAQHKEKRNAIYKNALVGSLLIYSIVNLCVTYVPMIKQSITNTGYEEQYDIINWMENQGYYYGYADYMDANCMTMLSEGEVQIASVLVDTLDMCWFVTDRKWYTPYLPEEMETVYIIRKSDADRAGSKVENMGTIEVLDSYETENYNVYVLNKNISSAY